MAAAIFRTTHVLDATGQAVGRLATRIAGLLNGKHKKNFEPHIDAGDTVIVKNARALLLTGKKLNQKVLRHHTNYPGGLKERPVARLMQDNPQEVLRHAVQFMIPKNRLRKRKMRRLKITA